jgi:hypothetical protein
MSPCFSLAAGGTTYTQGTNVFRRATFHADQKYFDLAKANYTATGDRTSFIKAQEMAFKSEGCIDRLPI